MLLQSLSACLSMGLPGPGRKAVTGFQGSCSQKSPPVSPTVWVTPSVQGKVQEVACGLLREGNLLPGLGSQTLDLVSKLFGKLV